MAFSDLRRRNDLEILEQGWPRDGFEKRIEPIVHQMMFDRAWIVSHFSQVEFLIADTIVKCRRFPEYAEIARRLKFGVDDRVAQMRAITRAGPAQPYAAEIDPLLDRFLDLEETRHFFTHGFVSVYIQRDGKAIGMHFRRYKPPKKVATRSGRS